MSSSDQGARSASEKRDDTLVARAALQGFELRRLADGRWLISKWNLQRELEDDQVEAWLDATERGAA
jgi:hypothetical protein